MNSAGLIEQPMPARAGRLARAISWVLGLHPRSLALLALLLCAPSLGDGLQGDDHLLRMKAQQQHGHPLRLFQLGPEAVERARANGALAWWASTADGAPQRVRFELPEALDARTWLIWNNGAVEPFTLPAIGERMSLPALDVLRALGRD